MVDREEEDGMDARKPPMQKGVRGWKRAPNTGVGSMDGRGHRGEATSFNPLGIHLTLLGGLMCNELNVKRKQGGARIANTYLCERMHHCRLYHAIHTRKKSQMERICHGLVILNIYSKQDANSYTGRACTPHQPYQILESFYSNVHHLCNERAK